jgi:preprotein translocase subunit SecG
VTPSPLEVVGLICLVIGVNVGAVYAMEALPKAFGGPRRNLALAGVLAAFLIALAMDAAVMLQAGRQAANFAILGLLPALMLTRVATRAHPRNLQLGLLALGLAGAYGIIAILLWGLGKGPQDDGTWILFAVYAAIPLILGYLSLRRILRPDGEAA